MKLIAELLIGLVALEHIYILWIEMFAWTTKGQKTFRSYSADFFIKTKSMAANQGLYNGFLAAGLLWSLLIQDAAWRLHVACFFLGCIIVAGIFGAITVQRSIFFVQSVPAILALVFCLLAYN
jgi:putative membrane protein